jgi:uncharacterized protein
MRLALEKSLTRRGGWVEVEIQAPPPPGSASEYQDAVKGRIVLTNTGTVITADGWLHTIATIQCGRCATPHAVDVRIEVAEECALADIDDPAAYRNEWADDSPIPIRNGDQIDLSELVRQLLNLHLPSRSLCRPDCRGLCPSCGQDLNESSCSCAESEVDPRLAALTQLRLDPEPEDLDM